MQMPRAEYDALEAVNWSSLKHILRSPAHYRMALQKKVPDTPAFKFGRACHAFVLEGKQEYAIDPEIDRRTKDGKKEYEKWLEGVAPGTDILTNQESEKISNMSIMIQYSDSAQQIMDGCQTEDTLTWEMDGIPCKARADLLYTGEGDEESYIADYKTTQDARWDSFHYDCRKWHYHAQLAWYCLGASQVHDRPFNAYVIAQEKDDPHAVKCYRLSDDDMADGATIWQRAWSMLRHCREVNEWPSYDDEIVYLNVNQR